MAAISVLEKTRLVIAIAINTIVDTPAHNPSSPSIKLMALVIPMIQAIVTNMEMYSKEKDGKKGMDTPLIQISPHKIITKAATSSTSSFFLGERSKISSKKPTVKIRKLPMRMALI